MSPPSPRILVVDDEAENIALVRRILRDSYAIDEAPSADAAAIMLEENEYAAIVTDQRMPGMSGVELMKRSVATSPQSVRIIVSAYTDTQDILDAINHGHVDRFVVKPIQADSFANTIKDALQVAALRIELEEKNRLLALKERELSDQVRERTRELEEANKRLEDANERLKELALRDGLTGLYNHRYFHQRLEAEISRARRHKLELSLIFLDVDHFKVFNDTHGHPAGDELLRALAELLKNGARVEDIIVRVRTTDVVARYGGEEFAIILPETPSEGAMVLAERLRRSVAETAFENGETQPIGKLTVSVGVATFPHHGEDGGTVVTAADRAMYQAKESGRNQVCLASKAE